MGAQRSRMLFGATVNGYPVLAEIDEFTPPEVKKVMEEVLGGRFIPDEIWVGLEKMNFELKISGPTAELLAAYGLKPGEICQVDVKSSEVDADGRTFKVHYSMSGEITGVKEETVKSKTKPGSTITASVKVYKKTEDGKTIYNINTITQVVDLGKGDVMAVHRRNVGIS